MMDKGRRVRGVISGVVCGLGIATLLQQFAVVPMTTGILVGIPFGIGLIGLALGWPRAPRGASPAPASTEAPTASEVVSAPE